MHEESTHYKITCLCLHLAALVLCVATCLCNKPSNCSMLRSAALRGAQGAEAAKCCSLLL